MNKLHNMMSDFTLVGLECHSGLSALIIDKTFYQNKQFDFIWFSGLTNSAIRGLSDNGSVDLNKKIQTLSEIKNVTDKPIIFDADDGGSISQLCQTLNILQDSGVDAVIIEDKIGKKENSFIENQNQKQDTIENFCLKIKSAKLNSKDILIITRIESLILGNGMDDALIRAKEYINSGADAIMIHSKSKTSQEIKDFCKSYNKFTNKKPLVVIPSTYTDLGFKELHNLGVDVVIYANQMLRASHFAMTNVAENILKYGGSSQIENELTPIQTILGLYND